MFRRRKHKKLTSALSVLTDAMETHFQYTYGRNPRGSGSRRFHRKTVKEYATAIKDLSDLL
jgi:hypothetical protein